MEICKKSGLVFCQMRQDTVGLNSGAGCPGWIVTLQFPLSVPPLNLFWGPGAARVSSQPPGISHLQWPQPAEQGPSHPGVPFLSQRVQRRWTHALHRANMGHLGQCGLSSLAMCTRSAMWISSDYVPRETRCEWGWGVRLGGGWARLRGSKLSQEESWRRGALRREWSFDRSVSSTLLN